MASTRLRVAGFRASGVRCGIKPDGLDLALIASDAPAAVEDEMPEDDTAAQAVPVGDEEIAAVIEA